jgi:hypothetical protein
MSRPSRISCGCKETTFRYKHFIGLMVASTRLRLKPVPQQPDILERFAVPLVVGGCRKLPRRLLNLPFRHYTGAANVLYESQPSVTKCDFVTRLPKFRKDDSVEPFFRPCQDRNIPRLGLCSACPHYDRMAREMLTFTISLPPEMGRPRPCDEGSASHAFRAHPRGVATVPRSPLT